jgi:hypothetical protein
MIREGVYVSDAARALAARDRSEVLQTGYSLASLGSNVRLAGEEAPAFNHKYWPYPGIRVPQRFVLTPGKHVFNFYGGYSWKECTFELVTEPGHVYEPYSFQDAARGASSCSNIGALCGLSFKDRAPDGTESELQAPCGTP